MVQRSGTARKVGAPSHDQPVGADHGVPSASMQNFTALARAVMRRLAPLLLLPALLAGLAHAADRPHIVYIMADDLGWQDLGYLGKDAAGLIAKHDPATPLFLMLAFTAPAAPLQAPREFLVRNGSIRDETRRTYAAMVTALDDAAGMVATALEHRGMLDNTLIVFHSDNGGAIAHKFATGDGDIARGGADNGPYRDGMGTFYEGGVRVAAFMRWNKGLESGLYNGLMHVTDLYPTLLGIAGAKGDQRRPLDGVDQFASIAGGRISPRKELLLGIDELRGAIRVGDWKLILHSSLPQQLELYDVPHDPGEEDNATDRNPDLVKTLLGKLNDYAWEMAPSRFMDDLKHARRSDMPIVWGQNPIRHGATSESDSRNDPSLTTERADRPK